MSVAGGSPARDHLDAEIAALLPVIGRVVRARVSDRVVADDLVQETVLKVLAAADRVDAGMLEPYAIATARNLVASMWQHRDRDRRNLHKVVDLVPVDSPDTELLASEDRSAMATALERLTPGEREALLAHEVAGMATRTMAEDRGSSPGAVAAQLHRARARLRVEYLIAAGRQEPPSPRCRPVLLAVSMADQRRQDETDAGSHLADCDFCAALAEPLVRRGQRDPAGVRLPIRSDPDIVLARRQARECAARLGFPRADLTLIATAVSEVTRNIVRFAGEGAVYIELLKPRAGVRVVARDHGPGIDDVSRALRDGYSTTGGLGLGLAGARRLMDEFEITSAPGEGTTVTMIKWRKEGWR